MEDVVKFRCRIESTDPACELKLQIQLNDQQVYANPWVKEAEIVECELPVIDDHEYELKWVLYGKTNEHTQIDSQGNIVKDALIKITDVAFDGIELNHLLNEQTIYRHNFNGNGDHVVETFNNFMGCNGTVTLKFTAPFYLWLLEKM
jgi:hypothetical protein